MKQILLRLLIICTFAHLHIRTLAQDSSHLRISLLTCTPGDELYATFGHSALRVVDSSSLTDIVFNYGTFNFDDDGFYLKFVRGKLLYYVSTENFSDFKYEYQSTSRGITEQVLNFSADEKIKIQQALFENIKEQNKYYKYDFFFDNCTTRLRDIIRKHKSDSIVFKAVMPAGTRFRQAIHQYLDKNEKYWSKLSIDLLLGARCDAVMTAEQSQFLPDNLMMALDSSNQGHQLVISSKKLYSLQDATSKRTPIPPLITFSFLFLVIFILSNIQKNWIVKFLNGFDGLFFFLTGAIGIILLLMWFATNHAMCKNNFNLLWALPSHAVMSFFIASNRSWVKKYFAFTAILLALTLLSWFFLPQQMNNAFLPIIFLLTYRSYRIYAK
ncbi:DUF4105 domain-containing protein [Ferruginibacter sp. SUN002]|uniref:Lnb N-terminal periplasmic domain-containing protein n=1 Tax=Ferruginibacter sp. SUN002 TaxID=2937789 RepID=UPI003D3620E7